MKFHIIIAFAYILLKCKTQRLPNSISPVNYSLTIEINEDTFKTNKFTGEVKINFKLLKAEPNLMINWRNLSLEKVELKTESKNFDMKKSHVNDSAETMTLWFQEPLPAKDFSLLISFQGMLDTYTFEGFYKSHYKDKNGKIHYMAATHFQPHYARRAFPCFDEPALKAVFTVTLVYPKKYKSWSNTFEDKKQEVANSLEKVTFKPTPKMSTYLVAFIIAEYMCESYKDTVLYRACSTPETISSLQHALKIAHKVINSLENFTGIPYKTLGINKLDMLAIPDFSTGAMENWGLQTYRQQFLLCHQEHCSIFHKQKVAQIVAHEISHTWFGNYVTLKWWSDVFLNEGLTTYFETFTLAEIEKEWQFEYQFNVENFQIDLNEDIYNSSTPLSSAVTVPQEYLNKFFLAYGKGGAVIRMISHVVGLDKFRSSIKNYLQTYKFSNTIPKNLWTSFEQFSNKSYNFTKFANTWILQGGHPLLKVELQGTNIIIKQEQFLFSGKSNFKWYIPITYTTSNEGSFSSTATQVWFTPEEHEIKLSNKIKTEMDWIVFNNQQIGFYRVQYDKQLWKRIYNILKTNRSTIHVINRAQIVNDLFTFAEASKISYSQLLDSLDFLAEEIDYYPWLPAFNHFESLLGQVYDKEIRKHIYEYMNKLISKLHASVVYTNNHISRLKKMKTMKWACSVGEKKCINFAKTNFEKFKQGYNINPDFTYTVFCTSLKNDKKNEDENWDLIWRHYKKSEIRYPGEALETLKALSCVKNEKLLMKYLDLITEESEIRKLECPQLIQLVASHPDGADATFSFMMKNFQKLVDSCSDNSYCMKEVRVIGGSVFKTNFRIEEFKQKIEDQHLSESAEICLKSLMSRGNYTVRSVGKLEDELKNYFISVKSRKSSNFVASYKSKSVLIFNILLIVKLF